MSTIAIMHLHPVVLQWWSSQRLAGHLLRTRCSKKDETTGISSPTPGQSSAWNTPDSVSDCSINDKPHCYLYLVMCKNSFSVSDFVWELAIVAIYRALSTLTASIKSSIIQHSPDIYYRSLSFFPFAVSYHGIKDSLTLIFYLFSYFKCWYVLLLSNSNYLGC